MTNLKITTSSGTFEIPDSGYLRSPETVCPKTPLHIREMTSKETIQQTKEDIALLQEKLKKLEEMEKHKSPVEEAYKEVYGCYPPTTPSVSNSEDERWSAFQKGYNVSKEEYKVEEPKPEPETLYWALTNLGSYDEDNCDEIADAVEEWLPDEIYIEYGGAYERGWNDALYTIKNKLR
jgi:hypothetical protein